MPTIVGILTCMSKLNFVLSGVEYEKRFITLVPALSLPRRAFCKSTKDKDQTQTSHSQGEQHSIILNYRAMCGSREG